MPTDGRFCRSMSGLQIKRFLASQVRLATEDLPDHPMPDEIPVAVLGYLLEGILAQSDNAMKTRVVDMMRVVADRHCEQ